MRELPKFIPKTIPDFVDKYIGYGIIERPQNLSELKHIYDLYEVYFIGWISYKYFSKIDEQYYLDNKSKIDKEYEKHYKDSLTLDVWREFMSDHERDNKERKEKLEKESKNEYDLIYGVSEQLTTIVKSKKPTYTWQSMFRDPDKANPIFKILNNEIKLIETKEAIPFIYLFEVLIDSGKIFKPTQKNRAAIISKTFKRSCNQANYSTYSSREEEDWPEWESYYKKLLKNYL